MSTNGKPIPPKAEAMAKDLKESLAERRPRPWRPLLVTAVVAGLLALLVAGLIWYPRAPKASLLVLAFDDVGTPEEAARAQAQLLAPPAETSSRRLRGEALVFVESARPGVKPHEAPATTDATGKASVDWPIVPPTAEFQVRHLAPLGNVDRGVLYAWPRQTPLLIVDADETLGDPVPPDAVAALAGAYAADWRVVYLALADTTGHDFRKRRDWVNVQAKLPKGPVLGRSQYPNTDDVASQRRAVLTALHGRFKGPQVAVLKNLDGARDLGVRLVALGGATTWADVSATLKELVPGAP